MSSEALCISVEEAARLVNVSARILRDRCKQEPKPDYAFVVGKKHIVIKKDVFIKHISEKHSL